MLVPTIHATLLELVDCLCTEISNPVRELPAVCRCGPMPGASAALDFGPGDTRSGNGQAWVRYGGFAPAEVAAGGGGIFNAAPCAGERIHEFELGISRCEPAGTTSNNRYTPPTLAEQAAFVELTAADMAAMEAAVCCLRDKLGDDDVVIGIGAYTPLESSGGVGGGTLQVFIQRSA